MAGRPIIGGRGRGGEWLAGIPGKIGAMVDGIVDDAKAGANAGSLYALNSRHPSANATTEAPKQDKVQVATEQPSEAATNTNTKQAEDATKKSDERKISRKSMVEHLAELREKMFVRQLKSYGLSDKQIEEALEIYYTHWNHSEKERKRDLSRLQKMLPDDVIAVGDEDAINFRRMTQEERSARSWRSLGLDDKTIATLQNLVSRVDPDNPDSIAIIGERINETLKNSGLAANWNPSAGQFAFTRRTRGVEYPTTTNLAPHKPTPDEPPVGPRRQLPSYEPFTDKLKKIVDAGLDESLRKRSTETPLERWQRDNKQTFAEKSYDHLQRLGYAPTDGSLSAGRAEAINATRDFVRQQDIREQTPFHGVTDDSQRLRVLDPGAVTSQGTFRYDYNTRKLAEQMRQQGLMLGETPSGAIVPVRIDENNQPQIVSARGFTPRDMMVRRPVETRSREQMMFDAMERAQATGQYNPRTAAAFARRLNNGTLNLPQLSNEQIAARERWKMSELARQAGGGQRAGAAMTYQNILNGSEDAYVENAQRRYGGMPTRFGEAYYRQVARYNAQTKALQKQAEERAAMTSAAINTMGDPNQNVSAAVKAAQDESGQGKTKRTTVNNPF